MAAETATTRSADNPAGNGMTSGTFSVPLVAVEPYPTGRAARTAGPDARRIAVLIGLMFLAATLTFMVGDRFITSAFEPGTASVDGNTLTVGVGLIAACGVAVAAIGAGLFRVLRRFHRGLAWGQMAFRLLEWATLWGVGGYMLATHEPVRYEVATYGFTGTAGLIATYALGRHGLIPGWLARLGIVGYVAIALTVPSELLDIVSLDSPAGMLLYLPGAAFELMLPVLLITRGFRPIGGDLGRHSSNGSPLVTAASSAAAPVAGRDNSSRPETGSSWSIGRIVAGSLLAGLVIGLVLVAAPLVPAAEGEVTGALLCGFAAGWAILAFLSDRFSDQPQRWAAAPAVFMGLGGAILLAFGSSAHGVLKWVWPPALLALVVWMAVRTNRQLRSGSRWLVYPVLAVLLIASIGGTYETVADASSPRAYPTIGEFIDVGGHSLYLRCSGSGSPTVVLEPGGGEMSSALGWIEPSVAPTTRVCVYDRAGRGWSEPAQVPQDATQIATDLHTLLERGGIPGPYVLAGHSFGGLYVLTFAARYPDDVAGMVLIDSTAPASAAGPTPPSHGKTDSDLMNRVSMLLSSSARIGLGRLISQTDYDSLPSQSRDEARGSGATPSHLQSTIDEFVQANSSRVEAAALSDFADKPLVVLTAGRGSSAEWMADQDHLATLSSNSTHRVIDGAVHIALLHDERFAAATTKAVLDVVSSIRTGRALGE